LLLVTLAASDTEVGGGRCGLSQARAVRDAPSRLLHALDELTPARRQVLQVLDQSQDGGRVCGFVGHAGDDSLPNQQSVPEVRTHYAMERGPGRWHIRLAFHVEW
jgi:hypothetical protein